MVLNGPENLGKTADHIIGCGKAGMVGRHAHLWVLPERRSFWQGLLLEYIQHRFPKIAFSQAFQYIPITHTSAPANVDKQNIRPG